MKLYNRNIHISDFLPPVVFKLLRYTSRSLTQPFQEATNVASAVATPTIRTLTPFAHRLLDSYSQHSEDLILDLILSFKNKGFNVDVGANDPTLNSNTKRFYLKGWTGINVEPGLEPFKKLCEARPLDVNLNVGIAPEKGSMTFYQLSDDTTLSSLNKDTALKMAAILGLTVSSVKIPTCSLENVFDDYLNGRHVDFLSVDAEGFDLNVLMSNNWEKHRPSLIIAEINNEYEQIVDYLANHGYLLIYNNNYNGLFLDTKTDDPDLSNLLKRSA